MGCFCHLCACPVVDGGVQLSQVDPQKLSQWWLINLGTKLERRSLKEKWICQFCVWDIRFLHDSSESSSVSKKEVDIVWWPQLVDPIYETYYKGNMLRRCFVELKRLPEPESLHLDNKHENSEFEDTPRKLSNLNQALVNQNAGSSMEEKFKNSNFVYNYCKKYNRKKHLHSHMDERHPDRKFRCMHNECNMSFLSEKDRSIHLKVVHEGKVPCIYCKKLISFKHIRRHMTQFHDKIAMKCSYRCASFFESEKERSDHVELVHGGENRVQCFYCTELFSINHIRHHIKVVHCEIALRCSNSHCASYFNSENDKRVHEKYAHGYFGDKTKCVFCQKFIRADYYFRHVRREHRDLAVKCRFKLCPKYYASMHHMEKHFQETHKAAQNGETFKCCICNQDFKNKKCQRKHIQRFHSDAVVKCKIADCGIYFKCLEDLDQHFQAKHAKNELKKIHQCPHCSRTSKRRCDLRKHISSAHGSAIFQCEHCPNVKFISKQLTLEHITKMHCPKPENVNTASKFFVSQVKIEQPHTDIF